MIIKTIHRDDVGLISVGGKLIEDADGNKLGGHIDKLVSQGFNKIIIDLYEVEWIGSSTLGEFIKWHKEIEKRHGVFCLVAASKQVKNLLTYTGLIDIFTVHSSVDKALADIQ